MIPVTGKFVLAWQRGSEVMKERTSYCPNSDSSEVPNLVLSFFANHVRQVERETHRQRVAMNIKTQACPGDSAKPLVRDALIVLSPASLPHSTSPSSEQ